MFAAIARHIFTRRGHVASSGPIACACVCARAPPAPLPPPPVLLLVVGHVILALQLATYVRAIVCTHKPMPPQFKLPTRTLESMAQEVGGWVGGKVW